jgi:hypothetical protein
MNSKQCISIDTDIFPQKSLVRSRSEIILIPQISPTIKKDSDYSLNKMFFDPSKSSPPNQFMEKLRNRIDAHNFHSFHFFMNDESRDME